MPETLSKIGKYKILGLIGKGGMGAVYKAEHPTLKRPVIIKKLASTNSHDLVERFKREARIMMDFRHEHIVQVFDHFKEGSSFYIVMEYVDGMNLEDLIKNKRYLSNEAAMLIFREVCKALKYAHDHQVIHRDIKPANILISNEGIVKLVDFGVSTELEEADDDGLTKAGMTIGTPAYLAPEQIANAKNRDKRSDIYSLGAVLYEMVIGKTPFRGGFRPEVITAIQKGKYTPPRKINPQVKPVIERVIKKAMHRKVQRRYKDLQAIINKFSRCLGKYKDQTAINHSIRLFLEGKDDLGAKPKRQIPYRRLAGAFGAIILVGAVAILGAIVSKGGYYYEYFKADEYGALRIEVKLRKGYKSADECYLNASLYRDVNNRLVAQSDKKLAFREEAPASDRNYFHFVSNKVYLKEGLYKVIIYAENEQYRETFYLAPRRLQKLISRSTEGRLVQFSGSKTAPRLPLDFKYNIRDIYTGNSLNKSALISIYHNNRWISWDSYRKNGNMMRLFTSGRRYRFRFKNEGYYTKTYYLTVHPEQSEIKLNLRLTPIPGVLYMRTTADEMDIMINNSSVYVSGERRRKSQTVKPLTKTYQKFTLSPSEYFITAKLKGFIFNQASSTKKVEVQSGKKTFVTIIPDENNKSLKFDIK